VSGAPSLPRSCCQGDASRGKAWRNCKCETRDHCETRDDMEEHPRARRDIEYRVRLRVAHFDAPRRDRTGTPLPEGNFKFPASANFARGACRTIAQRCPWAPLHDPAEGRQERKGPHLHDGAFRHRMRRRARRGPRRAGRAPVAERRCRVTSGGRWSRGSWRSGAARSARSCRPRSRRTGVHLLRAAGERHEQQKRARRTAGGTHERRSQKRGGAYRINARPARL
jgi:hypothetical protein